MAKQTDPTTKTRILVCGGRYFNSVDILWRTLDKLNKQGSPGLSGNVIEQIIDGASDDVTGPYIGADYWAWQWALSRRIRSSRYHADWNKYGKSAGPIRNAMAIELEAPHLVVAFPGGNGTENMKKVARAAGVEVMEICA